MEDKDFDFSKKPDLSKLYEPIEENKKPKKEKVKKPVSLGVKEVLTEAPTLIVEVEKNRWIVKVLIVLISAVLVGTGLYFVLPEASSPVEISIDFQLKNVEFDFIDIQPYQEDPTDIKLMPGDSFLMRYTIASIDDDEIPNEEVFVRVKFYAICDDIAYNNLISLDTTHSNWLENWTVGADGYLYYNGTLNENESFDAVNRLMLSTAIGNEFQGKTVQIVLLAECLQAGENGYQSIQSEWETAPYVWKDSWKEVRT